MNHYRLLADLVVVHLAWLLFIVGGLLLTLIGMKRRWPWVRNFWFRTVHLAMMGIVVAEAAAGLICPLTTWESQLRTLAGETAAEGTFVGRVASRVLFYDLPQWMFRVLHITFGGAVLLTYLLAPPRWPRAGKRTKPGKPAQTERHPPGGS